MLPPPRRRLPHRVPEYGPGGRRRSSCRASRRQSSFRLSRSSRKARRASSEAGSRRRRTARSSRRRTSSSAPARCSSTTTPIGSTTPCRDAEPPRVRPGLLRQERRRRRRRQADRPPVQDAGLRAGEPPRRARRDPRARRRRPTRTRSSRPRKSSTSRCRTTRWTSCLYARNEGHSAEAVAARSSATRRRSSESSSTSTRSGAVTAYLQLPPLLVVLVPQSRTRRGTAASDGSVAERDGLERAARSRLTAHDQSALLEDARTARRLWSGVWRSVCTVTSG